MDCVGGVQVVSSLPLTKRDRKSTTLILPIYNVLTRLQLSNPFDKFVMLDHDSINSFVQITHKKKKKKRITI